MKLVTAIVKPFKLDEIKVAVKEAGVTGLTVTQARGFGSSGSHIEVYRGREYEFDFTDKIRVECVCTDELAEAIIDAIVTAARTDTVGDGVAWITDVEHVVHVRTGERGPGAL